MSEIPGIIGLKFILDFDFASELRILFLQCKFSYLFKGPIKLAELGHWRLTV